MSLDDNPDYTYEVGYTDACRMVIRWMLSNQTTFDSWEQYSSKLLTHMTEMRKEQDRILLQMENQA